MRNLTNFAIKSLVYTELIMKKIVFVLLLIFFAVLVCISQISYLFFKRWDFDEDGNIGWYFALSF